ncbi:uncharacterized protein TRAVEDRAFT_73356 [Trametes versicolor FP-101664 SS1]|uniref:uncharacterized protein n=1 Tax=Trametes versicolor (strain FP-101664) TaxID=717944 RepID=UPI000462187B|nr:uncharacterized protein TRAVEDRAFT_73356 [Trametes versicolor FP-101664 SS1]EIW55463.1 hypothetical protein TRAVEDRAFT_73356 [Trametes versicolor FP-101664 SS1]
MSHIFLLPQSCITQLLPRAPKPVAKKIPATIRETAPDGSIREREVCKMGAIGMCPRGDRCRYAHITESELESEDSDDTSESSATDDLRHDPELKDVSQGGSVEASNQTSSKKSREICRLYFTKGRCFMRHCKHSHNILDLARLPPDHKLVLKNSEKLCEALAAQVAAESSTEATTSSSASHEPPAIADTAKKRQKGPRKPGIPTSPVSLQSDGAPNHRDVPATSKGKGRAHDKLPDIADRSAGTRPKTRPASPKLRDDADGDSTDATFYSADSQLEGPRHSPDTSLVASQPMATSTRACLDYVNGRCHREVCRYSHNVDREQMRLQYQERTRVLPPDGMGHNSSLQALPVTHPLPLRPITAALPPGQQQLPHVPSRGSGTGRPIASTRPPPGLPSSRAPVLPPGLGLETLTRNASQPQASPESFTITVLDSTKVTFGPGFIVTQVVTGFECRQIILEGVPASAVPASISEKLAVYGMVTTIVPTESDQGDKYAAYKVTFASGDAAAQAVAALNGKKFLGRTVSVRLAPKASSVLGGGTFCDTDVLFELPAPWQKGFIGFPTEELAHRSIALAKTANVGLSQVHAEMFQGIPNIGMFNVRFSNLPPNFTPDDLKKHFVHPLDEKKNAKQGDKKKNRRGGKGKAKQHPTGDTEEPEPEPPTELCEGVMIQRGKYTSLQGAFAGLKRMLQEHDEDVSINALPPPYHKFVRVWAHFSNPTAASNATAALDRFCPRFVGKGRIFAQHVKTLRYSLPASIFDVLSYDIDLLRSYLHDDENTTLSVIDKRASLGSGAAVIVKLVSQSMTSLTKAKATFDRVLRGEKVTHNGQIVWNDFFASKAGEEFLRELEEENPRVKINSDPRRRTLALFGVRYQRERVRDLIVHRVRLLKSQKLHRYPVFGHLVGVFVTEDLPKLRRHLGYENAWFDLTNQQLVVQGDEDAQKVAQLAVLHAQQRLSRRPAGDDDGCPVCFSEPSHPVSLPCGHTWCKACLVGYLHASIDSKSFPLTCLADSARCAEPIALSTAQRLLSTDEFDAVVNAAFVAHVQQHPSEFHYCPTPDCPQVYRTATAAAAASARTRASAAVLQCPSCLARICAHCNTEAHEGGSCQDRNPEDELLFEQWKMGHDVKSCPGCKVPIERAAGCNHMTCASCKIHICWVCLATFAQSAEVYEHMRGLHGGIGL